MTEKQDTAELDALFAQVDIKGKLAEALKDILATDARVDNGRTMKILLLYQAGLTENMASKLDAIGSILIGIEKLLEQKS